MWAWFMDVMIFGQTYDHITEKNQGIQLFSQERSVPKILTTGVARHSCAGNSHTIHTYQIECDSISPIAPNLEMLFSIGFTKKFPVKHHSS